MLRYIKEVKNLYDNKEITAEGFISHIWEGIKKSANKEHVVEKATEAFLELWMKSNKSPVRGKDIITKAGFKRYHNSNSHGLWPWLEKNGNAGVIEQWKNDSDETVYSVNDNLCNALLKVVIGLSS